MSLVNTDKSVLDEIQDEVNRQILLWGSDRDHADVIDDLDQYGIIDEYMAKDLCDLAFKEGRGSWGHIFIEEVAEAIGAPTQEHRREELIQVAAVIVTWVKAMDKRKDV